MTLIRHVRYKIKDGPTLRGNGPHGTEFVPLEMFFSGESWVGVSPSGHEFRWQDLASSSLDAWQELCQLANRQEAQP